MAVNDGVSCQINPRKCRNPSHLQICTSPDFQHKTEAVNLLFMTNECQSFWSLPRKGKQPCWWKGTRKTSVQLIYIISKLIISDYLELCKLQEKSFGLDQSFYVQVKPGKEFWQHSHRKTQMRTKAVSFQKFCYSTICTMDSFRFPFRKKEKKTINAITYLNQSAIQKKSPTRIRGLKWDVIPTVHPALSQGPEIPLR